MREFGGVYSYGRKPWGEPRGCVRGRNLCPLTLHPADPDDHPRNCDDGSMDRLEDGGIDLVPRNGEGRLIGGEAVTW
jgi:hypothetical protein